MITESAMLHKVHNTKGNHDELARQHAFRADCNDHSDHASVSAWQNLQMTEKRN